jgi:uncharacterized membrane protein YgcG
VDVKPIIKDADSSLEAFQTIKKNFHKLTCSRQLELLGLLVKLHGVLSPAYFNQFFLIVSELAALSVNIPQEVQGLILQVLMAPPTGTTRTLLTNLVLAAWEKSLLVLGPRDIDVIYNLIQSENVNVDGAASSPFQVNQVAVVRGGGQGGSGSGGGHGGGGNQGGFGCGGGGGNVPSGGGGGRWMGYEDNT